MNFKYLSFFILLACFLFNLNAKAQLIPSDNCGTATMISVGTSCTSVNYTSVGATYSGSPTPTCSTVTGDVWFQLVIPASGHLQVKLLPVTAMTLHWAVYIGTCAGLTELKCITSSSIFNLNDPNKGGQTMFIRAWRSGNSTGGVFSICAWETSPPSNDDCANATILPVGNSCNLVAYNNIGCTGESTSLASNPTCGAYQGGDIWFKILVPVSGHLRLEKTSGVGVNQYSAVYSGTCGSFTQLICQVGNQTYNINNLALAGQYIYLRIWDHITPFGGGTINLCAWEPLTPFNDSCANALLIPVGTSCNFTTYNNIGCTAESPSISPNPTCGIYQGGDVWFKVVVPSSGHLRIEKANVLGIGAQSTIYTGTCGSMIQLTCLPANQPYNINDLSLAGQTLYIRVWDFNNAFGGGSFNLCAWETNPPLNDFCANATPISVGTTCTFNTYNNIGCTAEATSTSPIPTCGIYQGGDVWFKVVVPGSGHLRIEKSNLSINNAFSAIYSGTCGTMTQLECTAGNTSFNLHNHAMAGQTLYIRVWDFNAAFGGGTFNLCAWEPSTAENDFCVNAIQLTVGSTCIIDSFNSIGCTAEASSVAPIPTCGFYQGGDMWFKVTMPLSGHLRIEKANSNSMNVQYALFQGGCGTMTQLQCAQNTNTISIHDHMLGGQTIYLRIWNFNDAYSGGRFGICVSEPNTPENDFCSNAIPLTVGFNCVPITYSSLGCTAEVTSVAANPTCAFYSGGDMWFTVVMPNTGLLSIDKSSISPMNAQFALYTGTCGAFIQIACSQLQNSFTLNNISLAGQTLYLRIWNYSVSDGGTFSMCLYDPTCLVDITNVTTSPTSCTLNNDGSLTVTASCALCIGALEYSINNGTYQSSPVFSNLDDGFYIVKARDSGKPLCLDQWTPNAFVGFVSQAATYYEDLDGDNYGKTSTQVTTCFGPPLNYVLNSGDCNDTNPIINPGMPEITCNGVDENCNGILDDTPGEINVLGNCTNIADGDLLVDMTGHDGTSFGLVTLNQGLTNTFTIENTEPYPMLINSINISGTNATMFVVTGFTPNTTLAPNHAITFDVIFTPTSTGVKNATITIVNSDCNESNYDFALQGQGTTTFFSELELNLFIEGYYIGFGEMTSVLYNQGLSFCQDITDSITVELHHATNFSLVSSTKTLLHTYGAASCRFPSISGNYYIVVKHRNGLQTWSASPVSIGVLPAFYDFAANDSLAYGNNLVEVDNNLWGIYAGDLNLDENIDLLDIGLLESDINNFEFGYRSADINGDGNVDLLDGPVVENNINNFIYSLHP